MENRFKFTDANVARLTAERTTWFSDTIVRSLQLAVGPSSKTWYVTGRVKGSPAVVRVKLGKLPAMTVPAARRAAEPVLSALEAGHDPRLPTIHSPSPTLQAVLEDFIDTRTRTGRLSAATAKQYRDALNLHCAAFLDRPLPAITKPDMRELHSRLSGRRALANQLLRVLRSLFKFAIEVRDVDIKNPTLGIDPYKLAKRGPINDLAGWFSEVTALPNFVRRNFYLIAAMTGIRRRNLGALPWSDVDLDAKTISLLRTKSGTSPVLPISDEVARLIGELKGLDRRWVFPASSKSGHIEEPKEKTVRGTIHHCRHIFTSAGGACSIPEYVLMRLRGDVTARVAMHGYMHDVESHAAVNLIAEHLKARWSAQS